MYNPYTGGVYKCYLNSKLRFR